MPCGKRVAQKSRRMARRRLDGHDARDREQLPGVVGELELLQPARKQEDAERFGCRVLVIPGPEHQLGAGGFGPRGASSSVARATAVANARPEEVPFTFTVT